MKMSVRPELTTAPPARVRNMRHTDGAVDNSALLPNHPGSTYKSGNAVQTAGAASSFNYLKPFICQKLGKNDLLTNRKAVVCQGSCHVAHAAIFSDSFV